MKKVALSELLYIVVVFYREDVDDQVHVCCLAGVELAPQCTMGRRQAG